MKKTVLLTLLLFCGSFIATAQDCNVDFLGTKTLYKKPVQKYTPPPAGFSPVFINHVGRHGARHLTKGVETYTAYADLLKADSLHQLTPDGKKLKQMVLALQKVEGDNVKSISVEGQNELEGIGTRLYENYSNVFKDKQALNVRITKEKRTQQSADAFLSGLNKQLKTPVSPEAQVDDVNLRFYDLSPAYVRFEKNVDRGGAKVSFDRALQIGEISKTIAAKFFSPAFLQGMDDGRKDKFVSDILSFATIVYSLKDEIEKAGFKPKELDFKSFFSCDELAKLSMSDSADEYLKKGPGINNDGVQVRVAVPLLVDFIKTTDEFILGGQYNAQLRFAHAETIAPFAALLQITGADKASKSVSDISKLWQASKVIPLSANIQWVFYKKQGSDDYLVKILLNEKEAHITGLNAVQSAFYSWKDLRAFYIEKLTRLHVTLNDDMKAYLANLK